MPRKVKSSGEPTQSRRTSLKRAVAASSGSGRKAGVPDGGKWAGSGRKTVEHRDGPSIVRQGQPGRGPTEPSRKAGGHGQQSGTGGRTGGGSKRTTAKG